MRVSTWNKGRRLVPVLAAMLFGVMMVPMLAQSGIAATVQVDLDRSTALVDTDKTVPTGNQVIQGAIVVTGDPADMVTVNVTQILVDSAITPDPANAGASLAICDLPNGFVPASGDVTANNFIWVNTLSAGAAVGADGVVCVFTFNVTLEGLTNGQTVTFSFANSADNSTLGLVINQSNFSYGPGGENPAIPATNGVVHVGTAPPDTPTPTFTNQGPIDTPTPTQPSLCADAGYYVLTSFGDHIAVGNPPQVNGNISTPGVKNFGDMEVVRNDDAGDEDLAIMDQFGVVTFIQNQASTPAQDFLFDNASPNGLAVDVVVSDDYNAFWVLTTHGGIYRAGTANPGTSRLGNDADDILAVLGIPFPPALRDPNAGRPNDGATLRAVGLAVVPGADNQNPTGFIVLDSQGGTFLLNGQGTSIRDNQGTAGGATGTGILDASVVYPFFPGLDVARDIELHPSAPGTALVIYDGFGGVHPVPVDVESPVRFLRNETAVNSGILLTTVGLPYLVDGFDNPDTMIDEGDTAVGAVDVNSIFTDIEFCQTGRGDGVYVMDKFGGVFAFGSTRAMPDSVAPQFTGSPYFFPNLWAVDMEASGPETVFAPGR
jgi:hypothetical protein